MPRWRDQASLCDRSCVPSKEAFFQSRSTGERARIFSGREMHRWPFYITFRSFFKIPATAFGLPSIIDNNGLCTILSDVICRKFFFNGQSKINLRNIKWNKKLQLRVPQFSHGNNSILENSMTFNHFLLDFSCTSAAHVHDCYFLGRYKFSQCRETSKQTSKQQQSTYSLKQANKQTTTINIFTWCWYQSVQ